MRSAAVDGGRAGCSSPSTRVSTLLGVRTQVLSPTAASVQVLTSGALGWLRSGVRVQDLSPTAARVQALRSGALGWLSSEAASVRCGGGAKVPPCQLVLALLVVLASWHVLARVGLFRLPGGLPLLGLAKSSALHQRSAPFQDAIMTVGGFGPKEVLPSLGLLPVLPRPLRADLSGGRGTVP